MNGQVYLISSIHDPLIVKIGRTKDWLKRRSQLKVGRKAIEELVVECHDMCLLEKRLHQKYADHRLPGTEWFVMPYEQVKSEAYQDISSSGRQIYFSAGGNSIKEEGPEQVLSRDLPRDHPLNEQLQYFCEDWDEEFTDLFLENPWVTGWLWQWEDGEGFIAYITYTNPDGEEEEMRFCTHEIDKIHVYFENYERSIDSITWHHQFLGRNYFDIPLDNPSTTDLVHKNIFAIFDFLEDLPYENWPVAVKARKLSNEQRTLELEAMYGPVLSEEEIVARIKEVASGLADLPKTPSHVN
jgi:hypothetical protein